MTTCKFYFTCFAFHYAAFHLCFCFLPKYPFMGLQYTRVLVIFIMELVFESGCSRFIVRVSCKSPGFVVCFDKKQADQSQTLSRFS